MATHSSTDPRYGKEHGGLPPPPAPYAMPDEVRHCEERSDAAIQEPPGPAAGPHRTDAPHPIGSPTPARLARLLALNNAHTAELSLLDPDRLVHLLRQATWAARIGDLDAFVIVLDHAADYDSPNHRWFRARYPRFAYVDRIAVAPHARGRGLARTLYAAAIQAAAATGHTALMAEVNSTPPNPASDALHAALGFQEVGAAPIHNGAKTVRYLRRPL